LGSSFWRWCSVRYSPTVSRSIRFATCILARFRELAAIVRLEGEPGTGYRATASPVVPSGERGSTRGEARVSLVRSQLVGGVLPPSVGWRATTGRAAVRAMRFGSLVPLSAGVAVVGAAREGGRRIHVSNGLLGGEMPGWRVEEGRMLTWLFASGFCACAGDRVNWLERILGSPPKNSVVLDSRRSLRLSRADFSCLLDSHVLPRGCRRRWFDDNSLSFPTLRVKESDSEPP
jgi:hypothetical protein